MKYPTCTFLFILLFFNAIAQTSIRGRVINQKDTKPVANASVFLNNATVGDKTANDGTFVLKHARPGKYNLVVSIIGFDTYTQSITINNADVTLPDITIFPKIIGIKEVTIKAEKNDPEWEKYYERFKKEFFGRDSVCSRL